MFAYAIGLACISTAATNTLLAASPADTQSEFFENKIRPILVEHCYACHNSAETAEAGIKLDSRQGVLDADIIEPGFPEKSYLMDVLRHQVEDMEMPKDGPKLEDRVLEDFSRWIEMGAPDPRDTPPDVGELADAISWEATLKRRKSWWSFQPIRRELPPNAGSTDHPVDQFVTALQEQHGLTAAPRATNGVLVRRLYFALIGLPPLPGEAEEWVERLEAGQEGYEALVDHLLQSRHFGERWARHWMDWIRYAESHGSEGDPRIDNAWQYRDYLIRALNLDVPYDQLIREHIAGDLLEKPRINDRLGINESAVGPTHWRMVFHGFAPTDALDEKVRFIDDQVNTFSKAFLGLTVSCARCHDHKFDAISQKDYYSLFAILAACRPARTVIDTEERQTLNQEKLRALKPRIRQAIARDWQNTLPIKDRLIELSSEAKQPNALLHPLYLVKQQGERGHPVTSSWQAQANRHADQQKRRETFGTENIVTHWNLAEQADYSQWYRHGAGLARTPSVAGAFALQSDGDVLEGIYPSGIYSHLISAKQAARLTSRDFDLKDETELWIRVIGDSGAQSRYVVQDYPRNGTVYPVTNLSPTWKWQRYDLQYWTGDSVHIELATGKDAPLLVKNSDRSWFGIRQAVLVRRGTTGPVDYPAFLDCIFADDQPLDSLNAVAEQYTKAIEDAVQAWERGSSTDAQAELLWECVRLRLLPNQLDLLPTAAPFVNEYRSLESEIPVPTRVPGLDETHGRKQALFVRGNHKTPGELVERRFLEAIDSTPYPTLQSGRLELAKDLLRGDNPLTRRVIVNRIWHHLFGNGIVATPDNFGRLGSKPTHPALLDYLATRFKDDGWSIKKAIRLIVTSKTWQQSSVVATEITEADPRNLYLARTNLRRLDAEAIRDSMLLASGRLDARQFGASVDERSDRRSIYVRVIRNSLPPLLRAFDFPEPFTAKGRRDVTNVPAQSLTLMNDRQVLEYAKSMADNSIRTNASTEERIRWMFNQALCRHPTKAEVLRATEFLEAVRVDAQKARTRKLALETKLLTINRKIDGLRNPARDLLIESLSKDEPADSASPPEPWLSWSFESSLSDDDNTLKAKAHGGSHIADGALIIRDGGYVTSGTLPKDLAEKTLEAWVQLDDLRQRGGGVMTVQTRNGVSFDSIVFGEQSPGQWLAGSNNFARTQSFGGPAETLATKETIHIAITYQSDGTITGYRNGVRYGKPYKSRGLKTFQAGDTIISFGVRHLPASGNRLLAGQITRANLYDRALTDGEVLATSKSNGIYVTEKQIRDALEPVQREKLAALKSQQQDILQTLADAEPTLDDGDLATLTELARAIFTFKEFIFIQ